MFYLCFYDVLVIVVHSARFKWLNTTAICINLQTCFTGRVWMSLLASCRRTLLLQATHVQLVTLACSLPATSCHQLLTACVNFSPLSTGLGLVWDCHWWISAIICFSMFYILYSASLLLFHWTNFPWSLWVRLGLDMSSTNIFGNPLGAICTVLWLNKQCQSIADNIFHIIKLIFK